MVATAWKARGRVRAMGLSIIMLLLVFSPGFGQKRKTTVSIRKDQFLINNKPTYAGRYWNGHKIEGLLMNSRMVQGIFDDANPQTSTLFEYPDTKTWDADRNTKEFVAAMSQWHQYGLNAFTLNLQGGSPVGYGNKDWRNSAFDETGNLRPAYFQRLDQILRQADKLGMVVILGYFYFGQDQYLQDEQAVLRAVDQATDWLLQQQYRNVIVEVNNECDIHYDHAILKADRVHELIRRIQQKQHRGRRLLVSTSYSGGFIPRSNVVSLADFILLHGNGVGDPARITEMVRQTRAVAGYRGQPIVFNEDDHYDFEKPENNFVNAVKAYASWGFFDFRRAGEGFAEGYQSVPVDWGIHSARKKSFFEKVKQITGAGS